MDYNVFIVIAILTPWVIIASLMLIASCGITLGIHKLIKRFRRKEDYQQKHGRIFTRRNREAEDQ